LASAFVSGPLEPPASSTTAIVMKTAIAVVARAAKTRAC
jgi:hypothetical protein